MPCLLALMVLSPAIDAVVCGGDTGAVAAPAAAVAVSAHADHKPAERRDAGDLCQHGHCHHSAPMLIAQLDGQPAHISVQTLNPARGASAAPSLAPAGPDRPPRA